MSRRRVRQLALPFDTYVAFLVVLGLAVATFQLDLETREVILWCVLVAAGFVYLNRTGARSFRPSGSLRISPLAALSRGAAIGLLLTLPILLIAEPFLATEGSQFLPVTTRASLFMGFVLVAPIVEEFFFRGQLQLQHGLAAGILTYGLYHILFFLPILYDSATLGLALAVIGAVLGFLYGYVFQRYGLAASTACHMVVNFMLLILPSFIQEVTRWL